MTLDMATVSRRVKELRNSLKLTQAAFGRRVGADQSTVSKWESGQQIPEGRNLFELAKLANMTAEDFLGQSEIKPANVVNVSVIGSVQAGQWVEALAWPHEDQYELAVTQSKKYPNFKRFGLEVAGASMDRLYPEGTILLCIPFNDLGRDPRAGERVIVERRSGNDLLEVTVKEYVPDDQGRVWLWPRSTHPEYQQPLPLPQPGNGSDVNDVRIIALVVGSYRDE